MKLRSRLVAVALLSALAACGQGPARDPSVASAPTDQQYIAEAENSARRGAEELGPAQVLGSGIARDERGNVLVCGALMVAGERVPFAANWRPGDSLEERGFIPLASPGKSVRTDRDLQILGRLLRGQCEGAGLGRHTP